jgi:hypothetical protein
VLRLFEMIPEDYRLLAFFAACVTLIIAIPLAGFSAAVIISVVLRALFPHGIDTGHSA